MTRGQRPTHARNKRIDLGGLPFHCPCHICGLFESQKAQYAVLLPFGVEGIGRGERCLQFVDKDDRTDRLQRMTAYGLDVEDAQRKGSWRLRYGKTSISEMESLSPRAYSSLYKTVCRMGNDEDSP